jgi:predicted ester cyclase
MPPTGRRIDYTGLLLVRLEGQAIAEFWAQPDQLGIFKQRGDAHHEPGLQPPG